MTALTIVSIHLIFLRHWNRFGYLISWYVLFDILYKRLKKTYIIIDKLIYLKNDIFKMCFTFTINFPFGISITCIYTYAYLHIYIWKIVHIKTWILLLYKNSKQHSLLSSENYIICDCASAAIVTTTEGEKYYVTKCLVYNICIQRSEI